ncbi:MAG: thiol reductant ABC exporter subunit CydC [Methylococcales bacterium]|nr:thiol reductant ABC exporter subunit CydC [Methylococcales bacterium]
MKDLIFFFTLFKPYKLWLLTGVFLSLLTSLATVSLLTLSGWFITASAIAGLSAPDGVAIAFNFMQPAAEIRALAIIRTFGRYAERVVTHEATFKVLAEIRCWFFAKLIPLAPGRLAMKRSADLLSGITQDIDALDALYLRLCSPLLIVMIGGGAVVAFICSYSIQIGLFVFIMLLITAGLIPWVFNRLGRQGAKKIVEQTAKFKMDQIEILQGFADLSAFNAYTRYTNQIISVSEQMMETQTENNRLSAFSSAMTVFLSHTTVLVTLVVGSILFQQEDISGAVLAMLSFCVLAVFELVTPLASSMQLLAKTQTAAKRIRHIVDLKPAIIEPQQAYPVPDNGSLKINQLSFRYSKHADWVLKQIDLDIPQGSKIAIVGNSGAGKTTLLQCLMHFFDPQQGSIEYGGIDIKKFSSEQLMQQFSVLSQRSQLFSATVKENLLIAKPTASELEIKQAINMAGLDKFISQLPEGINTWVGEDGAKVSGGEARRIALARVYLKNAPILLLDEPTEGLDRETENEVFNALAQIAKHKTLIMVTHRQAGLRLVDEVYRMNEGYLEKTI